MCVCGGDSVFTRVFSAIDVIIAQEQCCSNILVLVGLLSWAVLFVICVLGVGMFVNGGWRLWMLWITRIWRRRDNHLITLHQQTNRRKAWNI